MPANEYNQRLDYKPKKFKKKSRNKLTSCIFSLMKMLKPSSKAPRLISRGGPLHKFSLDSNDSVESYSDCHQSDDDVFGLQKSPKPLKLSDCLWSKSWPIFHGLEHNPHSAIEEIEEQRPEILGEEADPNITFQGMSSLNSWDSSMPERSASADPLSTSEYPRTPSRAEPLPYEPRELERPNLIEGSEEKIKWYQTDNFRSARSGSATSHGSRSCSTTASQGKRSCSATSPGPHVI